MVTTLKTQGVSNLDTETLTQASQVIDCTAKAKGVRNTVVLQRIHASLLRENGGWKLDY